MLRDVFYYGKKPNVHPREKFAKDLADARRQAITEHFWIINEFCDYRNFDWDFDFEFLPDHEVWTSEHNNVWPSVYQKDSGTWLCSQEHSDTIVYRNDVLPLKRKKEEKDNNWVILEPINEDAFDFGWHPDPTDPPYIYRWGCRFFPVELKGFLEYRVPGATEVKYMYEKVELLPQWDRWNIIEEIDKSTIDFTWRPDPREPDLIYVFGNHLYDGTIMPTVEYTMPGATVKKYTNLYKPTLKSKKELFEFLENSDGLDYTWRPDPTSPPYIYAWGNQWNKPQDKISVQYVVEGATEYKYMDERAIRKHCMDNWIIPDNVDTTGFDFSWEPSPADPPYIYEFGTQWQKTGGPTYIVPGATQTKYIDIFKVKRLPCMDNWTIPKNVDTNNFDFSWHPDDTSPPYVYHFATQWATSGGPIYTVQNATESKYIEDQVAKMLPDKTNWKYNAELIDIDSFDFSWHPYVEDQPYIYQFGTQWQKTGGPQYITPGCHKNSPIKYIDTRILRAKRLPNKKNFAILDNLVIQDFDYSWHPDDTEEPYIYQFGNNFYPAEIMPTLEYRVKNAKQIKYVNNPVATLGQDKKNWVIPDNIDITVFDFSWKPNPKDPDYIYEFATQWQKNGGPKYVIDGATETKYMDTQKVKRLVSMENWTVPKNINVDNFDFSWHPDNTSPAYIYVFATQWALSGGPIYTVPGATETKYIEDQTAIALPDKTNWEYDSKIIDETSFDFSWHPYVEDQPYIYQFGTQHQKTGGPRYVTPGCHKNSPIKYIDTRILKAKRLPNKKNFSILNNYTIENFDYSWHPDDTDEPYIYVFGSNQYPPEVMPTIEYKVPGAKTIKYVHEVVAELAQDQTNWEIPKNIDITEFDFSWKPNPNDPPFIYQFGTQWQKTNGPRYVIPGAKQVKYVEGSKAKSLSNRKNYTLHADLIIEDFDYSWHPDETEPPYVYVFPTQWVLTGGPKYIVEGAKEVKYLDAPIAKVAVNMKNFEVPSDVVIREFDFSWHPHPDDPTFIYQFGTQHQKTGGPRYLAKGATSNTPVKYIDTRIIKAVVGVNMKNWEIPDDIDVSDFDFSWHPDDTAPPVIYQFGTLENDNDGPRYIVPGHTNEIVRLLRVKKDIEQSETKDIPKYYITTTLEDLIKLHRNEIFWALNIDIDYTNFDFSWRPSIEQARYVHAFGTKENINTQTYFISAKMYMQGHKDINYVELPDGQVKLKTVLDMFYVDRSNANSQKQFEQLKIKFPKIQKTRYLNSWVDTINRCCNRASSNLFWVLNSELDYSSFNFDYYPNAWQTKMVHVFGTQWSHWGTTFMVNKETFPNDTKYIKIIEHLNNLNFVKDFKAISTLCAYDIVLIDHNNNQTKNILETLQTRTNNEITVVKYENSYLNTLKTIVNKLPNRKEHFVWICSSICDYKNFDFSYIIDPFSRDQLHVFPSDKQKFGDTFFVDVNKLRELIDDIDILENYKVNYNQALKAIRLPAPTIVTNDDTHVNVGKYLGNFPYTIFVTHDNKDIEVVDTEPMSLWDEKTKNIIVTSVGATRILVPKEAKDYIKTQLYDYPYIKKSSKLAMSKPLDIVFLSNGEKNADENYEHLLKITKGLKNRVTRVDGVKGRMEAYHSALKASETSWAFTVFAKLKVSHKFDFNWQPDRLQESKHYIFQAKNPVNGLIYGHQAMIAYNKKLTFNNYGEGLDFTMDDPHEVVELLSGTANYNTDEFSTWRTAFREVIKLQWDRTEISDKRLEVWASKAEGDFAQYSLDGARDALAYFSDVNGEFEKLKLSYEWDWLWNFFKNRYKN